MKKKIKKAITPKRIAIIAAIITLISFSYKFIIGVLASSLVMIIAAMPTLFLFICKAMYAKNMNQTREEKKKAYLAMTIAITCFVVIFILFSVLKVGGIDITATNRFEGWIGIVFIFFIIVMFVLSIINLKGALNKDDILAIGIKEIAFVSALTDAVMIQDFLNRVIFSYVNIPFMGVINRYFPLIVGVIMVIVPILMIKRFISYRANR